MAATQGVQFSQIPQKKSRRADTPYPRGDPAPEEEEEDASTEELIAQADRSVLEEARTTGELHSMMLARNLDTESLIASDYKFGARQPDARQIGLCKPSINCL